MILLIQFRGDQSGPHEIQCIYKSAGLPYTAYRIINASSPDTTSKELVELCKRAKAVMLGGWGENGYEAKTSAKKKQLAAVRTKMRPVITHLVQKDKPTLGMCFGHQLIADIMGGTIKVDPAQDETGVGTIRLTKEGRKDPLLKGFGAQFHAILGHKASVTALPKSAVHLATTDIHVLQAFRFGKNVYGMQFHPELNLEQLEERLDMYPEYRDLAFPYDRSVTIKGNLIAKKFAHKARFMRSSITNLP